MTDPLQQLTDQAAIAAAAAWLLERVKLADSIPWVHQNSDRLNRALAAFIAAATAAGFTFAFQGSAMTGGDLIVHVPSLPDVMTFAKDFVISMLMQETTYRGLIKKPAQQ